MKPALPLGLLLAILAGGCGDGSNEPSPLTAPADYAGAVINAHQKAINVVDTTSLNQAIKMFQTEQGRNPKDLNELVTEKYIPKIPDPPVA
jgi:hypothetical protein